MKIKPFELTSDGTAYCDFLGFRMQQNRYAPSTWNYIIEVEKPVRIIEIGTGTGGFTCCLGIMGHNLGFEIFTFDKISVAPQSEKWFKLLSIQHYQGDVLGNKDFQTFIGKIITKSGKTIVLCDGGYKVLEFRAFAQWLKIGDLIAAHDFLHDSEFWPFSEINLIEIADTIDKYRLSLYLYEQVDLSKTGWIAFKKMTKND